MEVVCVKNLEKITAPSIAVLITSVVIAGCGVKSSPQPPDDSIYPFFYPASSSVTKLKLSKPELETETIRVISPSQEDYFPAPSQSDSPYVYPNPAGYVAPLAGPLFGRKLSR